MATKNAILELALIFNHVAPLSNPQLPPLSIVANLTSIHVTPRNTVHFNIPGTKYPSAPLYVENDSLRVDASPPRVGITPPYSAMPWSQRVDMNMCGHTTPIYTPVPILL